MIRSEEVFKINFKIVHTVSKRGCRSLSLKQTFFSGSKRCSHMEQKPEKSDRYLGIILGLLLWFIWIGLLIIIGRTFYPKEVLTANPTIYWLYLGPMGFLIIAGEHILYNRKLGGIETIRSLMFLKINIVCFIIWIIVIGLLSLYLDISRQAYFAGGYTVILIVYLLWNRNVSRKYPDKNRNNSESVDYTK